MSVIRNIPELTLFKIDQGYFKTDQFNFKTDHSHFETAHNHLFTLVEWKQRI